MNKDNVQKSDERNQIRSAYVSVGSQVVDRNTQKRKKRKAVAYNKILTSLAAYNLYSPTFKS